MKSKKEEKMAAYLRTAADKSVPVKGSNRLKIGNANKPKPGVKPVR